MIKPFSFLSTKRLENSVNTYLAAAISENTRKAYQQDIRHFIRWGGCLPATPEIIFNYLQVHAATINSRTLRRRLSALKQWHLCQGFLDPTTHPLIQKTLIGISRIHGKPPNKALPLSIEQLSSFVAYLKSTSTLINSRDSALLQIGFFGAFRRKELASLTWENITFVPEGLTILLARSKTDQIGEGVVCAIPYGKDLLCPVSALKHWQEVSALKKGFVFRAITKGNRIQESLCASSVNLIIKKLATACQFINPHLYSGHSLRRGFATSASKKGASMGAIMRQGRWRHPGTVQGYIEEGQGFEFNAAGLILK